MSYEQKIWENLHKNLDYTSSLPGNLSSFWKRCYDKNIDPKTDTFKMYSPEKFKKIKEDSIKIYAYANRFLLQMTNYLNNPQLGFALFDNKCCLLKLYGGKQFMDWCDSHGITTRTDWREESIGANAVSIGLETEEVSAVVGSQNFCHVLIDTAIYFSPFIINDDKRTHESIIFGGIALIVPFDNRNIDYMMMAAAAANDISLHLYMANSLYNMYYTEKMGLISIDINMATGQSHILYHNSTIFEILETPKENLYYKDADALFDPLPKNKEFWDIIESCEDVKDQSLSLSIRGKEDNYIVTTDTYYQENLGFRGVRFFITTSKQISNNVSKRIGNNAMLTFNDIIGTSKEFSNCIRLAKAIAKSNSNVLILGESGVGKDIFAQAIHNASDRRDKPFIALNCAAFPRELINSEHFRYEGGAFSGSKKNGNIGKFELADKGTLFLDEIGDMPLDLQATLLRVIEEKKFMRLGSSSVTNVDVRIIAATNANLKQLIEQKKFRADLYYRLNTLHLTISPLRDRGKDIILLAEHFIHSVSRRIGKPNIMTLSSEAIEFLCELPWNGNVRELQNLIEGIVQLYPIDIIEPEIIKEYLNISDNFEQKNPEIQNQKWTTSDNYSEAAVSSKNEITKEVIENALMFNKYNKTNTAEYLGISRKTLYRWMESYGINS
jgi:transcriptional regulator with PAS, ATPase and Fis domain